jgi:hypothetical protein
MAEPNLGTIDYESKHNQVSWQGVKFADDNDFDSFMVNKVSSRLNDEDGISEFKTHLNGLASTGFAKEALNKILEAEIPEERDWAIGEAFAEAYLSDNYNIIWPWNMDRDKRNPMASLPGADLVGFEVNGKNVRLALGEVKTSGDADTPPNVMCGRSGMIHQIDNLANNLGILFNLLKWLLVRCKGTEYEECYNAAISLYLNSKNVALFGVLIRDTTPNEKDLKSRGIALSKGISHPATCHLIAMYLPCTIESLPTRISERAAS